MQGRVDGLVVDWADQNFGTCELGDERRTKRAVTIARGMVLRAAASIPMQAQTTKDSKAAYRFFDTTGVTFSTLATPHWKLTRQAMAAHSRVLVIQDSTALSFSGREEVEGLGPIGDHETSQGLWLHNALVVTDEPEPMVLGLAYQEIWARTPAPKGETENQRRKRPRESERWARTVREIGKPGECRALHVCDREADIFELYEECAQSNAGFVVRVQTVGRPRQVYDTHEGQTQAPLPELIQSSPTCGSTTIDLRARPGSAARSVQLEISVRAVRVPPPRIRDRGRTKGIPPVPVWVVRVWEPKPPKGVQAIEWTLVTSEQVADKADALRVIDWYRARWLVEEYHKCLKSGCAVEERQLETADRLMPLVAMLGVTAVRLLQLKMAARQTPDRPAMKIVPEIYLKVLGLYRGESATKYTCRSFWRGVAALGGFLGRKGDGDPGWLTLWRGWQQLELLVTGAKLLREQTGRCG